MESGADTQRGDQYPVQFSVEYPDRDLDRLMTAFRIIVAIPILIVLGAIGSGWGSWGGGGNALRRVRRSHRRGFAGARNDCPVR